MSALISRSLGVAVGALASLFVPAAHAQQASLPAPGTLQSFTLPADLPLELELAVMLDGVPYEVTLTKRSWRSPNYAGYVSDGAGGMRALAPIAPSTYRGTLTGRANSLVGAWLSAEGLHAAIVDEGGAWVIEPAGGVARREIHRVTRFDEISDDGLVCGTVGGAYRDAFERGGGAPAGGSGADTAATVADVAYDADSVLLARYADANALQAAMEGRIAQSSVLYEYYTGIQYAVSGAVVRTAQDDPYLSQGLGSGSSANSWLLAFRAQWNQVEPEASIDCDLAHLFTGITTLPGSIAGIAYIGAVCNDNLHYGLSSYTGNDATSLKLFCHEVGHNWNACHCDASGCTFDSGCGIMSSQLGGGVGTVFGSVSTSSILAWKNGHNCFDSGTSSPAPSLTSITPAQAKALPTARITLDGDDLDKTQLVYLGASVLDPSDFVVVDAETIELLPPRATALGTVDVSAAGPGGTSASLDLEYVETSPPDVVVDLGPNTIVGATWTYAGLVGKNATVLLALDGSTSPVGGFQVLTNGSVADQETLVDPGLASFSRNIPTALIGSTLYLQVLIYDGSTLIEVSEVRAFPVTG